MIIGTCYSKRSPRHRHQFALPAVREYLEGIYFNEIK